MPEPQITQLLDRAVHHAPQMHLTGEAMLAAGKGRVRRRRAVGVGGVLATAAVVAALWGGLGGGADVLTGTPEIRPATSVWEPGETVEGTLFTGLQTIDDDQVGHTYAAELSRTSGEGPVTLTLSDGGRAVEEVTSTSPVPGLDVFAGERMTVAVWTEPAGVVASVPLVGPYDPGGPANVQHADVGGEEVAYAVWSADVVPLPEEVLDVYLVGRGGAVALSRSPLQPVSMRVEGHRLYGFVDVRRGVLGHVLDDEEPVLVQLGDRPAQAYSAGGVSAEGAVTTVAVLPEGAEVERGVGGFVGWSPVEALDRPLVLLLAEDASEGALPEVEFGLGGESYTLGDYVQDLRELRLADGTGVTVLPGAADGRVELGGADAEAPRVTFVHAAGESRSLATRTVGGSVVALVEGWDAGATVLADARVEVAQDGTARWVVPTDVAQVTLDDGRLVTLLAVDAEDSVRTGRVTAVGVQEGAEVRRWQPSSGHALGEGVELPVVDGSVVPTVDGQEMARVGGLALGDARLYRSTSAAAGEDLLVLPAGLAPEDVVVPVLRKGESLDVAPGLLGATATVRTDAGDVRVVAVPAGMLDESARLALRSAAAVDEGSANTWTLLGASSSGHLVIDPGLVVSVAGDGWLLHEEGDDSSGTGLRAGLVGLTLEGQGWPGDELRYQVVAVLPAGSTPKLLFMPGAQRTVEGETVLEGPVDGVVVWTATVHTSAGLDPQQVRGLDLDNDGEPNLVLPFRG